MKAIDFERKYYIKDLFRPKEIINAFNYIEFASFNIFLNLLEKDLFSIKENKILHLNLKTIEELDYFLKILKETNISEKNKILIEIEDQSVLDHLGSIIPNDKKFMLLTLFDNKMPYELSQTKWCKENPFFKRVKINAENFREQINKMISQFTNELIRAYYLEFDYKSFQTHTLKDLNLLEFWLHHLHSWMTARKPNNAISLFHLGFHTKIYVDDDFTLYINRNKKMWKFPLNDYLDKDGETLHHKQLNYLRQYIDVIPDVIYSILPIINWALVDFSQNLEIGNQINEIPLIVGLINGWLYGRI